MSEEALKGVRVLDLTHYITGPFATRILAGFGADVIKIERPDGGDPARRMGPFYHDEVNTEKSGLFLYLNMGKRGVTLNLKHPLGVDIFKEMVKTADIVIESFSPGVMARLGLDYQALEEINTGLIMTSISNFGQYGPYRDYKMSELVLRGMGEEMQSSGLPERAPQKSGETISMYQTGIDATIGTLGALLGRALHGIGQHVDMSMMEALTVAAPTYKTNLLVSYQYCGEEQPRGLTFEAGYPVGVYPCQDGYFHTYGGRLYWPRIVDMMGDPDFLKDPKWTSHTAQSDAALKQEFESFFLAWTMQHTKQEIMQIAQEHRVPCCAVQDISDVASDPHLNERGAFMEISHPIAGNLKYPGRPFMMYETPFQMHRPAPLLGEHNAEIYGELGYAGEELGHMAEWGVI
jgi:crotonobetainyl-CoA:carnitine CoA-transferase CaiB-like acyl-CoA transferase